MMHLEAIQRRNAEACESAPRHRDRHIANAMEWGRRAAAQDKASVASDQYVASYEEYRLAGVNRSLRTAAI